MNEAWIVFVDVPEVTAALTILHDDLGQSGRLSDNLAKLIRAMAEAADISAEQLDITYMDRPFTPGPRRGDVTSGRN